MSLEEGRVIRAAFSESWKSSLLLGSSCNSSQDAHTRGTRKILWQTPDSGSGNSSRMPPYSLLGAFSHITHGSRFSWLLTLAPSLLVSQGGAANGAPDSWHWRNTLWGKTAQLQKLMCLWKRRLELDDAPWFPPHPIQWIIFNVFVLVLCPSSNSWSQLGCLSEFAHWEGVTRENNQCLLSSYHISLCKSIPIEWIDWFISSFSQLSWRVGLLVHG